MTIVAEFSIQYIQYLDQTGEPTQALPELASDAKTLLELFRWMLLIRTFDAKAVALQRTGKLGTFPASLGQEAVAVGMGYALQKDDVFVPYYRDQGTFMMRGIKPSLIFAYWGGDERGNDFNTAKEDLPICVPIATQYLHAAGIAYAIKYRKEPRAVLTICGDGGTSEGDFYEGINFAGLFKLPVVFVINNNQWAISVARTKQTATPTLAQKAIAAGFDGIQVDGNDAIAMAHTVQEALKKARNGGGPTLIEAVTYRLCDHTTADDARRYVDKEELENAWQAEPLRRLRTYLTTQQLLTVEMEEKMQAECTETIAQAVEEYVNMPPQPNTAMIDYMFAKLPAAYQQQRDEIAGLTIVEEH
jgi:2-oxoisovalerate dehydrogenase E1 component alpha subunit